MTRSTFSPARRKGLLATAVAVVFALLAVSAPASAVEVGTGPGIISGTFTTSAGEPVEGASVSVSSITSSGNTTTDAAGFFEFSGLDLDVEYFVNAYAQGHEAPQWQYRTLSVESPSATVSFVANPYVIGTGTITGVITGDGVPLPGEHVWVSDDSTGQSVSAATDENGRYEVTGLANGLWRVSVFGGSQYQTAQDGHATITDSAQSATVDINLVSYPVGTSTIAGVVTDSATGEPIANVNVNISSSDAPHYSSATTDESGAFSFELLPAGTYYLKFWPQGYLEYGEEIQLAADQSVNASQALVQKNATVSGRLVATDGTPVANTWVQAEALDKLNYGAGVSDDNGYFVISDLGGVAYTLSVGGYFTPYDREERAVTAVANADVESDFTLVARTTGSIAGTVLLEGSYYQKPVCATLYSAKSKKAVAERYIDGQYYGEDIFLFEDLQPGAYTVGVRDCDDDPATKLDKVFLGGASSYKDATFVTIEAAQDSVENIVNLTVRG